VLDLLGFCHQEGMILLQLFRSIGMTAGYQEFLSRSTSCQLRFFGLNQPVQRADDRVQAGPEHPEFLSVSAGQLIEHFDAVRCETHVHLSAVLCTWFANDQSLDPKPVDQANGAVVRNLQLLGEFSDGGRVSTRKSFDREECLILAWRQSGGGGCSLAEMEELPKAVAESRQRFILTLGHTR
jgi:hypothetical protein